MARKFIGTNPGIQIGTLPVYPEYQNATQTPADTTNFNVNLSSADDTVQKALETLDNVVGSGGGACFIDGGRADEVYVTACIFDGGGA
jgi:hypothetical protein